MNHECPKCGCQFAEAVLSEREAGAPSSSASRNSGAWPEWAVRALCALARRILHERNATCGGDWPAGQDWHELGHTSQHAFMRAAREECGVPHDAYRDAVQAICDSQEFDLDFVWQDMDARSEKSGYSPPAPVSEQQPLPKEVLGVLDIAKYEATRMLLGAPFDRGRWVSICDRIGAIRKAQQGER